MLEKYLMLHHKSDIIRILEDKNTNKHFSININFLVLLDEESDLSTILLKQPEKTLNSFENSIYQLQSTIILNENGKENDEFTEKKNVHARVFSLPHFPDLCRTLLPDSEDIGKFLQVTGTIVRMTVTKMLEYKKQFMCAKCKNLMTIEADFEQRFAIIPPKRCKIGECGSTTIISNADGSIFCKDYQEIKIQEQHSNLGMGRMPNSMWVSLEDDLVDVCKPGDDVTISGILRRRWKQLRVGKLIEVELVFKANHIQINNDYGKSGFVVPQMKQQFKEFWEKFEDKPLSGRNVIVQSICPEIFGMYLIKLALALVLAGGSRHASSAIGSTQARAESHMLLVGDPGMGKSQLLKFAAKIIPRSVLTTGIGSTSAGLTATAIKEDGEWQLEGGALVLADGGICCIDEFSSMKKQDRASIHEAMEQQTVSVAKAGVVCKLSTRCTVLAAMNPKVGLDATQPFGMNVRIASPLLSRFDVIFHLRDKVDKEYDATIAAHVLNGENFNLHKGSNDVWNVEMLQAYFVMIKKNCPVLTPEASEVLCKYYQAQRVVASRNKARTTVRLLDSLIRLSQAHAKLMLHEEVQIGDAVVAVSLIEASLQAEYSLLLLDFDLKATFPDDARDTHNEFTEMLLQKLKLVHLLENDSPTTKKPKEFFEKCFKDRNDKLCSGKGNVFSVESSSLESSRVDLNESGQIGKGTTKEFANEISLFGNKSSASKNPSKNFVEGFEGNADEFSNRKINVFDVDCIESLSLKPCKVDSNKNNQISKGRTEDFLNEIDQFGNQSLVNKNPRETSVGGSKEKTHVFSGRNRNVFDSNENRQIGKERTQKSPNEIDLFGNKYSDGRSHSEIFVGNSEEKTNKFYGRKRNVFNGDSNGCSLLKPCTLKSHETSEINKRHKEIFKESDLEMPKFKFKKQKDSIKYFEDFKKSATNKEENLLMQNESVSQMPKLEQRKRSNVFESVEDLEITLSESIHKKHKAEKIAKNNDTKYAQSNCDGVSKFDDSILKKNANKCSVGKKSVAKLQLDQFRLKYQEKNENTSEEQPNHSATSDNQICESLETTEQEQTKEKQVLKFSRTAERKQMHTENIFQLSENQKQTNEFESTSCENLEQENDFSQPQYQNKFSQFKLKQKKSDQLKKIAKTKTDDDLLLKLPSVSDINFSDDELADKLVEDGFNFDCESALFENTQASTSSKFASKITKVFESQDEEFDDNLF